VDAEARFGAAFDLADTLLPQSRFATHCAIQRGRRDARGNR
jgi:hypothetical protein